MQAAPWKQSMNRIPSAPPAKRGREGRSFEVARSGGFGEAELLLLEEVKAGRNDAFVVEATGVSS